MSAHTYDKSQNPGRPPIHEAANPSTQKTKTLAKSNSTTWLIPTALIILSLVPAVAGSLRLVELSSSAAITPDNARFFASPLPVVLHIVSVMLYSLLGAFQFAPGFRRHNRNWHRYAGRMLIPAGFVSALTGLWMSHFYTLPPIDGLLLYWIRLVVGAAMLGSLVLGVFAIYRRDFVQHGNWMIRAYAIGMGAGTQVLTHLPWVLFFGAPDVLTRALLMGAGWVINVIVAEWIIRTQMAQPIHAGLMPKRRESMGHTVSTSVRN